MLSLEKETFRGYGISLKKKKKKSGTEFIVLFFLPLIDDTRTTRCNFFPSHARICDFFHRALSSF